VADLVARLKSPGFAVGPPSAWSPSTPSSSLIEDLLDEAQGRGWSRFLRCAAGTVFVKNLESVQGDERDIMYFSITYGPISRARCP
jgi:hypothetical protein